MKNKTDDVIHVLHNEHCPFWEEVTKTIEEILKKSRIKAVVEKVNPASFLLSRCRGAENGEEAQKRLGNVMFRSSTVSGALNCLEV